MTNYITPQWPAPTWVRALTTTRQGGVSEGPYQSLNFGMYVDDNREHVNLNRLKLNQHHNFQQEPFWLKQIHSNRVVLASDENSREADGAWTTQPGLPCVVTTGDCIPLLLCDSAGSLVAAVHCGWRGMMRGIIENAIAAIENKAQGEILAWLGPAIGPLNYEVGEEVRQAFIADNFTASYAFKKANKEGKWMADMVQVARIRLKQLGVSAIYGGEHCTYQNSQQFYSYRRDGTTGRMATLIWLQPSPS